MRPVLAHLMRSAATPAVVSAITPSSQSLGGTLAGQTFSPSSLTVTGGGTPTYVWSFPSSGPGTWSVFSGQGTDTATARVTSAPDGAQSAATFRCTVTVDGVDYIRDTTLTYDRDSGGGATMTL